MEVSALSPVHWPRVRDIYAAGIVEGQATFETEPPAWDRFDAVHLPDHRWVVVEDGEVLGWVACAPTSARQIYAGVVEHSVYVDPRARGRGAGSILLDAVVESTEAAGIWTLQAGIFPENTASLALHTRHGFRRIGYRERVGLARTGPMAGRWRDVVLMERRSDVVG